MTDRSTLVLAGNSGVGMKRGWEPRRIDDVLKDEWNGFPLAHEPLISWGNHDQAFPTPGDYIVVRARGMGDSPVREERMSLLYYDRFCRASNVYPPAEGEC